MFAKKSTCVLQQCLPFTVLKLYFLLTSFSIARLQQYLPFTVLKHSFGNIGNISIASWLQQHTVCAEGCEAAEEQSDDEVRTSQVPERREGKTKVIK